MCVGLATTTVPWWRRGGMNVNEVGMAINILAPPIVLLLLQSSSALLQQTFLGLLLTMILMSITVHGMRTAFCIVVVPTYMSSLILCLSLNSNPIYVLAASLALAILKVAVCMSVCLHRYAAHAAFKCGDMTRLCLMILGCSANQGGPIWWASQHRCHHKYCDVPRDPHSCTVDGVEKAFAFFEAHKSINEEFAPKHCDNAMLRILDTWAFLVVLIEFILAFMLGGPTALFIQYTGSWMCQTMTLWFNIANHPPACETTCKAQDDKGPLLQYYPPFCLLNALYPVFGLVVAERNHKHHHEHSTLAKRTDWDYAYFYFVRPLEEMKLVWDVKLPKHT